MLKIGLMLVPSLVALRKESVDRNLWWGVRKAVGSLVALRKESVDRNTIAMVGPLMYNWSLSARRAWIEMLVLWVLRKVPLVALRKESVDRNHHVCQSSRCGRLVALRKESVDRNCPCRR